MYRIKNMNEVATGIFLILVSLLAFYLLGPLSGKTDVGLGPGFVPRMFASLQFLLGTALIVSGFLKEGEVHEAWRLRPLLVLVAIGFFAVTIEPMGLVMATIGLVLIACAANPGTKVHEALALAIGGAAFSTLLFVNALGLSIPILPPNLMGS